MQSAESRSRLLPAVALVPALLALQACYEDSEPLPAAADERVVQLASGEADAWLEPGSREAPSAWLSRQSGEAEARLAPLVQLADARWREEPRIIANRFAGLWRDTEAALPPSQLIADFLALPPRPEGTLAALIQSYRVLRNQGADHTTALRSLSGTAHD